MNRYDRRTQAMLRFKSDPENPNSLSNDFITVLFQDEEGVILVGTQKGLNLLDPVTLTFETYHYSNNSIQLDEANITTVFRDRANYIWIGTQDKGVYRFDRLSGEIIEYNKDKKNHLQLDDNWITVLYEDESGNLWMGTQSGGLYKYNTRQEFFEPINNLSSIWVQAIYEDSYGTLWVGTIDGLYIFDEEKKSLADVEKMNYMVNLSNNSVTSIYEDKSGVLWVGTENGGLNKFVRTASESFKIYQNDPAKKHSLNNNNVWSIFEDSDGSVWIGTHGGGVNRLNPETDRLEAFIHKEKDSTTLSSNFVNSILRDSKGTLWVGTIDGLNRFDGETQTFKTYYATKEEGSISGNIITTVYEDRTGVLWVGTLNNGLNKYDHNEDTFISYKNNPRDITSLSHNKVWSIYEDRSGVFWVGTHGFGLNKYNRKKGIFKRYTYHPDDHNTISNDFVSTIVQDKKGYIWIGTINGLNKFDPIREEFTRYTTEDGLPNNVIYGIIEDARGHLWLSTNKGIADFNPETEAIRIYSTDDGLPGNEYRFGAYQKGSDGSLYFGGIDGFVVFSPDSIRDNPYIPPVVITNLQIMNKDVAPGAKGTPLKQAISETDHIKLDWKDKIISFQFSALHFAAPAQNQYAYMMEGFDEEWQYVGNRRFTTYTNLTDRNYTFKVKAANKDGLWNEQGTEIKISIMPPPWKRWWAYLGYVVSGGMMLVGFINYRVSKERKKKILYQRYNKELEEIVSERTLLLEHEKEKSDALLYNILPQDIAEEIKEKGHVEPKRYEEVTVLFTDFENFTTASRSMSAQKLVTELSELFEGFDYILEKYELEKIKTIGDAYLAVGGLTSKDKDHARNAVQAALEMMEYVEVRNKRSAVKWNMRAGIHTGSIIAGVVGKNKFTFDIWGPTVNLASRVEELGDVGEVNISAMTCDYVQDDFECIYRGKIDTQGFGVIDMYFIRDKEEGTNLE